jgi:hypothetical protein
VVWQRNREKKQEFDRAHREVMVPIYERLLDTIKKPEGLNTKTAEEQEEFFQEIADAFILHGPSPVVQAWLLWLRNSDPVTAGTFVAWEGFLRALREDLGHDNSGLPKGDILRLFIKEDSDSTELWEQIRSG